MNRITGVVALWAFLLTFGISTACAAEQPAAKLDPRGVPLDALAGKLDRRLIPAVRAMLDGKASGAAMTRSVRIGLAQSTPAAASGKLPLLLDVPNVDHATLKAIQATGAIVVSSSPRWNSVSVEASLDEVAALTNLPGIRTLNLTGRPTRRQQGMANNQADHSMKADAARTATGLSGSGQKIGVVSDSIHDRSPTDPVNPDPQGIGPGTTTGSTPNATLTNLADQISGDLPATIQVIDFGPGGGRDEGAAMLELIHDVAPNAALAFAASGNDQVTMANNILALAQAGCSIIVDDIGFTNGPGIDMEPFFQDGPIAQAIRTNNTAGVTHFTAVGNDGDGGILTPYIPYTGGNPLTDTTFYHDWKVKSAINNNTSVLLPIDVPDGDDLIINLQWNQPYQSFNLGKGSSVDLDMILYSDTNLNPFTSIAQQSTDLQGTAGSPANDPTEYIFMDANLTGSTIRYYLSINSPNHDAATANTSFRVVIQTTGSKPILFPLGGQAGKGASSQTAGDMTAFGHTTMPEVVAVGAIFYPDIDSGGKWAGVNGDEDPNAINVEAFSSKGGIGSSGVPFYFDTTGKPFAGAPQLRNCPDIAAPDGGNTFFYSSIYNATISGTTYGQTNFPSFFGTSAAAPNAAAVAALLKERASLTTPAQIKQVLQATAIDVVATNPPSSVGTDDRSGAGLVNALAAVNAVPSVTNPASQTAQAGGSATFSVTASGNATLMYQWQKNGVNIVGANSPTLTLTGILATDDGTVYRCIVSNSSGTAVSLPATLTVTQPPKITQQPASQTVNVGSPATFTVVAVNGNLSYQWQRNGAPISGANGASYTLPSVTLADDGAQFLCVVSNQFGSTTSNSATLTANAPPAIVSGPTATPSAAGVGKTVTFSSSAAGAHGQAVMYAWNFGDGTTGSGAVVTHIYTAPAVYTVTLTVTDSVGGVSKANPLSEIIYIDTNGDGLPDLDPAGDNSSFVNALQTTLGLTAQPLSVKSLVIGLNFAKTGLDTLSLNGSLPVPAGFSPSGSSANVIAIVGGVGRTFTLSSKGKSTATPNGTFQLAFKNNAKTTQFAKFTLKLTKADIKTILAASSGLTDHTTPRTGEVHMVRATIFFNGGMYDTMQSQTFKATMGKTGKTK